MTAGARATWLRLGVVGSTNDEAARCAREGAPDGTVILATAQSAGRGRRGTTFVSPPGNLYLSLVLRPERTPAEACQLGFVVALALAETVAAFAPPGTRVALKWPNDVRANGAKIAGILLEAETLGARLAWVIAGAGLNIASHPNGVAYPATSLAALGAGAVAPERAADHLVTALLTWRDRWLADGFAVVRDAWLARAHGVGEDVRVNLDGESFVGRFADLDADGALLVALANGRQRRVTAGDVFFPNAA
ncbi:MAG: biotin--[acetyl-CoA-carboxylase] ligase [Alphaproteobacteria bacterium]|nr:biotin--[acetyl-CoA-carboxylase] ligase [Alphaproteobacteria bacterium]